MRYRILPYRSGSKSARALAEALGGKVLKLVGSTFKPKPDDIVINWGNTQPTQQVAPNLLAYGSGLPWSGYLNRPWYVQQVSNKLRFFNMMKEANNEIIPQFWTDKDSIPVDMYPIVCRTVLAGYGGAGIIIANSPSELVDASLYVKYLKKKDEYRVHIGKKQTYVGADFTVGPEYDYEIIAVQRKARRTDCENPNWQVRNHANGFVYKRNDVSPPPCVLDVASKAFVSSGLDFGAVDVLWNEQQEKAYVLEINTAPGLEGQTVMDYVKFFKGDA